MAEAAAENSAGGQCLATAKTTGQRCRRQCKPGHTLCYRHGGTSGRQTHKALAFKGVDEVLKFYNPDAPAVTDPFAELQRLAGIVKHAIDVAGTKVNELEALDSTDDDGRAQIKGTVQILMNLLKLSESVNATMARLNIDERVTEIQAARVALIGAALERAFGRVQLSVEQRSALDAAFAGELRAITAGHDTDTADDATLLSLVESAIHQGRST